MLGAGASVTCDFPTAAGLTDRVTHGNSPKVLRDAIGRLSGGPERFKQFTSQLISAAAPSVDAFLERRTEFEDVGKHTIAFHLLSRESNATLYSKANKEQGIYHYLWHVLSDGCVSASQLLNKTIRIVTFNYERSIDHFLANAVSHTYKMPYEEAAGFLQEHWIQHAYGSLGPLTGAGSVSFGQDATAGLVATCAESIEIVAERERPSPALNEAQAWIEDSELVVLIGFSFDQRNLERLRLHHLSQATALVACCYGMTESEVNAKARNRIPAGEMREYRPSRETGLDTLRNCYSTLTKR